MNHLFIIGAQRSGSTYLYQLLDEHPQIEMAKPLRPEPKFFLSSNCLALGREFYERKYFNAAEKTTLWRGEKSTSYIESTEAARCIHSLYPDARILAILRDPVQRAYSNYRFSVAHQLEPLSFREALEAEPERLQDVKYTTSVNPFAYCRRGHYIDCLEAYLKVFDPGQMNILVFEELVGNSLAVQDLYRWLGTDPFVPPSIQQVINPNAVEGKAPLAEFAYLASQYKWSIGRLEEFLGRRLDAWHERHAIFLR